MPESCGAAAGAERERRRCLPAAGRRGPAAAPRPRRLRAEPAAGSAGRCAGRARPSGTRRAPPGKGPLPHPSSPGRLQRLPELPARVSREQPPPGAPRGKVPGEPGRHRLSSGRGSPCHSPGGQLACDRGAEAPSTAEACRCIGCLHHTCISVHMYTHTLTYPDLTCTTLPVELT